MNALQAQRPQLGYVESGRFDADIALDSARGWREHARFCFRHGMIFSGKRSMRTAIRKWQDYRYYRERIRT